MDAIRSIPLPRLYERDIDCILQEELLFNEAVRELFSHALKIGAAVQIRACELSVFDTTTGETDVLAWFATASRRGVLLIENKIDAEFQPEQGRRYRERAAALIAPEVCELAHCVLIAPSRYAKSNDPQLPHFDAVISYEDLAAAIRTEATPRSEHRAALLLRACQQSRSSYIAVPDEDATELWNRIYGIAAAEFPELGMPPPGTKGGQSKWVIFKDGLPPRITLDWKITLGTVDLSFWKGAKPRPKTDIDLTSLRAGAKLELLGDTLAIRTRVPRPDQRWAQMPDGQIRACLCAAQELLDFYKQRPDQFE